MIEKVFTLEEVEAIIEQHRPQERAPEHNPGGIYIAEDARRRLCDELLTAFREAQ